MNRRADVDAAKGLAIVLVVFGHLVARQDPAGVGWYEPLRALVYAFHMPFFLYLSGLVAGLSGAARTRMDAWPRLVAGRARRLLVPFALFGVAIVVGKLVAVGFVHVDNVPPGVWAGLRALVWDTGRSPAESVWYLAVLFVCSVTAPVVLWAAHGRAWALVALTAILFPLQAPAVLYLDRLATYAVFFAAGVLAAKAGGRWNGWIDRHWRALAAGFAVVLVAAFASRSVVPHRAVLLVAGFASMPAIHGLARRSWVMSWPLLQRLGRASFAIYLLNTICIGLAKGVLLLAVSWNGEHFLPFALVLLLAGIAGPLAMKRVMLRCVPVLGRLAGWPRRWRRRRYSRATSISPGNASSALKAGSHMTRL